MNGPRFIADAMLGKLARWMRTLGFDVEYRRDITDADLIYRAALDDRIILTRDTLVIRRRGARGRSIFIKGDQIGDQLRQILDEFPASKEKFLTRCIRCNAVLVGLDKEKAREKVPPYVYDTQERFSVCPVCERIYWAGTHRDAMVKEIEALVGKGDNGSP